MLFKKTTGLLFLPSGTTMNDFKYFDLLKKKLELHMIVHQCTNFTQDSAPCHKLKIVGNLLKSKKDSDSCLAR